MHGAGDTSPLFRLDYYLKNEGTGPAFNIEHGVEVGGRLHRRDQLQYWAIGAGLAEPPTFAVPDEATGSPLHVHVPKAEWSTNVRVRYWTRFENLLGERFEVRHDLANELPTEFRRV